MSPFEVASLTMRGLRAHRVRALLNLFGVVVGVAATVVVIGLVRAVSTQTRHDVDGLGADVLAVYPAAASASGVQQGFGTGDTLTSNDVAALGDAATLPDVVAAVPTAGLRGQLSYYDRNWRTDVVGSTEQFATVRGYKLAGGRFLDATDQATAAPVAVIGQTVADNLFFRDSPLGQMIRIDGQPYRVVGVFAARGATGTVNADDVTVVPLSSAWSRLLPQGSPRIQQISVQAQSASAVGAAEQEVQRRLMQQHHITNPANVDFQVRSQQDLVDGTQRVDTLLAWMLLVVAAVSLTAGALGVANVMLASVHERTYEIGVRRAFGATRRNIGAQFLLEALALVASGGVLGALLGGGAAHLLPNLVSGVPAIGTPLLAMGGALAISLLVGVVAGMVPSLRAATLQPVDAIRT
ncbi:MAG TPA: ABC transporter permease [Candidatus Angelobacter sp.]|jgi:putative ABC transport system permease protein|nr:ABC transporter permease [Candidatus Angelobacter sp.]